MHDSQHRIALRIQYDGANFAGSQWQKNGPTIQGALELAVANLTQVSQRVDFAGRTDAGVHATGQIVAFNTGRNLPIQRWIYGLNHFLPSTVAVQSACQVPADFHPRYDASERTYHYHMYVAQQRQPIIDRYAWVVRGPLGIDEIRIGLGKLIGEHDFASFASRPENPGTRRTITEASVRVDGARYCFRFRASAFLPHQVRRMVGLMEQIGRGRIGMDCIDRFLADPRAGTVEPTAPPHGLVLTQVRYAMVIPEEWSFDCEDLCHSQG